jgi:hypothetical protein
VGRSPHCDIEGHTARREPNLIERACSARATRCHYWCRNSRGRERFRHRNPIRIGQNRERNQQDCQANAVSARFCRNEADYAPHMRTVSSSSRIHTRPRAHSRRRIQQQGNLRCAKPLAEPKPPSQRVSGAEWRRYSMPMSPRKRGEPCLKSRGAAPNKRSIVIAACCTRARSRKRASAKCRGARTLGVRL